MHRGLEITLVLDVDDDTRALAHLQDRPGDRAVVGEHPHLVLTQALDDGRDPQVERFTMLELHGLGTAARWQPLGLGRELLYILGAHGFLLRGAYRRSESSPTTRRLTSPSRASGHAWPTSPLRCAGGGRHRPPPAASSPT